MTQAIIEIPDSLPYPGVLPFTELKEIHSKFCYVFKAYPMEGISTTIARDHKNGICCIRLADFKGNTIPPDNLGKHKDIVEEIMTKYSHKIIHTLKLIGVPKAIFYFSQSDIPRLVDIRLSNNKFCGPGYLSDFFGKLGIPIQERVGDPVVLNEEKTNQIINHVGIYTNKAHILKPSAFKFILRGEDVFPAYGVIDETTHAP